MKKKKTLNKPEQSKVLYYAHIFSAEQKFAAIVWNSRHEISQFCLPVDSAEILKQKLVEQNPEIKFITPEPPLAELILQIQKYFMGKPSSINWASYDLSAISDFAKAVYLQLLKVPFGKTVSYKELAINLGQPGATRAVGRALGMNPIPLLIPCHRVIKSDSTPGGFSASGGIPQKLQLLQIEGVKLPQQQIGPQNRDSFQQKIELGLKTICRADPQLACWIKKLPAFTLVIDNQTDTFQALLEAIVYQQLTGKAAATIYARVLGLFGAANTVTPLDIVRAKDSELRKAGLSGPKILAVRDLAEKTLAGQIPDFAQLKQMKDDEIVASLIKVRGIGRWTAEMLLIFKLGRLDVLAVDDYGLKKGLAILRNYQNLPSPQQLKHEGRIWHPYRTIAAWYLWRIAEAGNKR